MEDVSVGVCVWGDVSEHQPNGLLWELTKAHK